MESNQDGIGSSAEFMARLAEMQTDANNTRAELVMMQERLEELEEEHEQTRKRLDACSLRAGALQSEELQVRSALVTAKESAAEGTVPRVLSHVTGILHEGEAEEKAIADFAQALQRRRGVLDSDMNEAESFLCWSSVHNRAERIRVLCSDVDAFLKSQFIEDVAVNDGDICSHKYIANLTSHLSTLFQNIALEKEQLAMQCEASRREVVLLSS